MAETFDPFSINISNSPSDPLKTDAEDNHEVSQIEAALAGVASGVLKYLKVLYLLVQNLWMHLS